MRIRLEEPKDYRRVETLTREAFWNVYRPGCVEHFILHQLRKEPCFVPELTYVLEEKDEIIAHIAYAQGTLVQFNGQRQAMLLFGPVSVLPAYQGKGYGSQLIRFTLDKAAQLCYPAVVITGNPAYYKRFGFVSASRYGMTMEGMTAEEAPFFMVKLLQRQAAETLAGVYTDPACYQVEEAEVAAFDSTFPQKIKEVRPGQLV